MNLTLPEIAPSEQLLASILIVALAFAGEADGTLAVVIIGVIYTIDLPALLSVACREARKEECS
jgi:hypothetical protein